MNESVNKEDQLISRIMKDYEMSTPSADFTSKVMGQVELEPARTVFKSKPLISTGGWIGIGVLVLILMLIIFMGTGSESTSQGWITEKLGWNFSVPEINLDKWRVIDFNNSTLLWIVLGSGGILLLTFIEKWIEENRFRHTLFL